MNEFQARNQLLVDALNSEEFKQTKRALRTDDGFCCLGVACEIYRRTTGLGKWDFKEVQWCIRFKSASGANGYTSPPREVSNWYGWGPAIWIGDSLTNQGRAEVWNDTLDANFKDIAHMFYITYVQDKVKIEQDLLTD